MSRKEKTIERCAIDAWTRSPRGQEFMASFDDPSLHAEVVTVMGYGEDTKVIRILFGDEVIAVSGCPWESNGELRRPKTWHWLEPLEEIEERRDFLIRAWGSCTHDECRVNDEMRRLCAASRGRNLKSTQIVAVD